VGWYGGWGRKVRWGRRKLLSPRRWGSAGVGRDGVGWLAPPAARLAWQVVGLFGLSCSAWTSRPRHRGRSHVGFRLLRRYLAGSARVSVARSFSVFGVLLARVGCASALTVTRQQNSIRRFLPCHAMVPD
jgi:hypothetical protein